MIKAYKSGDTIKAERNVRGDLKVETHHPMKAPGRVLQLSTWKGSRGGIATMAHGGILSRFVGNTSGFVGFKMNLFGDFSKTVAKADKRATAKALEELHAEALKGIEALLAEAEAYCEANPDKVSTLGEREVPVFVPHITGDGAKFDNADAAIAHANEVESKTGVILGVEAAS